MRLFVALLMFLFAAYVWGSCERGQLGLGQDVLTQNTPAPLGTLPANHRFVEITTGPNHSFARTGAFGNRRKENYNKPTLIEELQDVSLVSCGSYHTLSHNKALRETLACGAGVHGCLGLGDEVSEVRWRKVPDLAGTRIRQLLAGADFSLFLTEAREVLATGANDMGQLGLGTTKDVLSPTPIKALASQRVSSLACGWGHVVALTDDSRVCAWGANRHGQCGVGHTFDVLAPQEITFLRGRGVVSVACGSTHSTALTHEGHLFIWGSHADGKLGFDEAKPIDQTVPRLLELSRLVAIGVDHTFALTAEGHAYGWGFGQHGALGFPEARDRPAPALLEWSTRHPLDEILCGLDATFGLVYERRWDPVPARPDEEQ